MVALTAGALPALADGELHIYNWGDYTNPELIKKFEKQYNVKVTLDRLRLERYRAGQGPRGPYRLRHRRALATTP